MRKPAISLDLFRKATREVTTASYAIGFGALGAFFYCPGGLGSKALAVAGCLALFNTGQSLLVKPRIQNNINGAFEDLPAADLSEIKRHAELVVYRGLVDGAGTSFGLLNTIASLDFAGLANNGVRNPFAWLQLVRSINVETLLWGGGVWGAMRYGDKGTIKAFDSFLKKPERPEETPAIGTPTDEPNI